MLDRLDRALRADPHRPAVLGTAPGGAVRIRATRGDLADLADRYAAGLAARGTGPGDTVGVAVRPGPRALAVLLAVHRTGARVAVLDPGAGPEVLRARLALAPPALVLADAAAQSAAGWARPLARRAGIALPELAALGPVATVGPRWPGCAPALEPGRSAVVPRAVDGDGDAVVVFTSGTTRRPRAVVHTRSSLAAGMASVAELVRPAADVPVLGGTLFVLVPSLAAGAPVALPARSPRALVRQLRRLGPQAVYLTPPQLREALTAGARFTGARVWSGSAPVTGELLTRVRAAGAAEAWGVYALTELFPAAAVEQAGKAAFTGSGDLVGAPLPGVTATVSADGELLLSGPAARHRYLGEEPDPSVATGDRARIEGGRIVLAGRRKEMVLRRAENVYPGLYEPSLHVPGVDLALLVGVPAGDGDERLVAVVQPRPGADPARVRAALAGPLARMGTARPDAVLLARVPLSGRSRKPDRAATARLAAARLAAARLGAERRGTGWSGAGRSGAGRLGAGR
ncbi:class I adenylate-forming enzyme family protein [Streptomyces sp. JNUCC 64]